MRLYERELTIPAFGGGGSALLWIQEHLQEELGGHRCLRFAIVRSDDATYDCECGLVDDTDSCGGEGLEALRFRRRQFSASDQFNVALVVPTGIGAEIGGHAGDAGPVAQLVGAIADVVITHPNVVNASDVNELPENGMYVEGSVLARLLMGTVGLCKTRSNRVLVLVQDHPDPYFVDAAVNTVSGARASYGLNCTEVVPLDSSIKLTASRSSSGRAIGAVARFERVREVLRNRVGEFDAVAVTSVIEVPPSLHSEYYESRGTVVNPWGGVEAIFTHAISTMFDVQSAHSPMLESREIAAASLGVVDPRMGAEAVSLTFLQSVLKGLHRSPRIVTNAECFGRPGCLTVEGISCLVIPEGCLGLPTLAALEQGIVVIAVRENKNLMKNNLRALPWSNGQFFQVDNYWEVAGILASLKAGLAPRSVRRPLAPTECGRAGTANSRNANRSVIELETT